MSEIRIDGEAITDGEFEYTPDWYARVMVGGMSIVGISALAYKMGGPTGKAIKQAISRQIDGTASEIVQNSQPIPINTDVNLYHEIISDKEVYKPSSLPSLTEIKQLETDRLNVSTSLVNKIERLENAIDKLIQSSKKGDPLFKQLQIIEQNDPSFFYSKSSPSANIKLDTLSDKHNSFINLSIKIATLRSYANDDLTLSKQLNGIDYYDPDLAKKITDAELSHMNAVHDNLYRTNAIYAAEYIRQMEKILHDMRDNAIGFSKNPMVNPHIYGDVGEVYKNIINDNFDLINHSQDLFIVQNKNNKSLEVVKNSLANGRAYELIDPAIKNNIDFLKYESRINRIAMVLEDMARQHPEKIKGVKIKLQDFGTSSGHNTYLIINIAREWSNSTDKEITIKVPIADTYGTTPKINNFSGQRKLGYSVVPGTPGMWEFNNTVNLTDRYLDQVYRTLTSSVMNDVLEREASELSQIEKRLHSKMISIQDSVSTATGEARDIFKHNAVGMLVYDEFDMLSAGSKKEKMIQLQSGVNTILNMSRLNKYRNNGDLRVITIDLETLQLFGESSPRYMAGRASTGVWSMGIKISDGRGVLMEDNTLGGHAQFVSDHALKEHKIRELYESGKLLGAVGENGDEAVRSYAQFAKKNYASSVKSAGDQGLVEAIEAWIQDVDSQAKRSMASRNHYNSTMLGVTSSVDFANRGVDMIIKLCQEMRANGQVPVLNWANGTTFDGQVLNMLTGRLNEIQQNADILDLTDFSRVLKLGATDVTGDQLHSIVNEYVLKNNIKLSAPLDFKNNPMGAIRELSQNGILKAAVSKDLYQNLTGLIGKGAAAHNSSLLDVYLTDLGLQMGWDLYNENQNTYMQKASSVTSMMDGLQVSSYSKALSDHLALMGIEVDGIKLDRAGLSVKQLNRLLGSKTSIAEMMPYHSMNPHGKQLHQRERHGYIRRNRMSPKHRYITAVTTPVAQNATEFAYRNADMDRNIYANHVMADAFFTVGEYGNNEGHISVTSRFAEEFNNNMHHKKRFELDLSMLDAHQSGTQSELMSFLTRVYNNTKNQVQMDGTKLSGAVLQDEFRRELNEIAKRGGSINLDPNDKITKKYLLGPNKLDITESSVGKLTGISLGGDPRNGSVSKLLFEFMFEGSLNQGVIGNTDQGKSVVKIMPAVEKWMMASGKKVGVRSTHEMQTGLNMIDKGFVGTLKATILQDAVVKFADIINDKNKSIREREDAKRMLKKYAAQLTATSKDLIHNVNDDGTMTIMPKTTNMNPVDLTTAAARVSMSQVLEARSLLGGDRIHTFESIQRYYSMFAGDMSTTANGSIFKGRKFITSAIAGAIEGAKNSKEESILQMMDALKNSQEDMTKHLDPLQQAIDWLGEHKKMDKTKAMEYLSNENNRSEVDNLLSNKIRIPKLFEANRDMNDPMNFHLGIRAISNIGFNSADAEIVKQLNKEVHFKHSYFDNLLSSRYIPDQFKDLLMSNRGITKNSQNLDTAKSFASLVEIMKNNSTADMIKHGLNIDQIRTVTGRTDTIKRIKKMLNDIDDKNPDKGRVIAKALDAFKQMGLDITDQDRDIIITSSLKKQQDKLNAKLASKNVISEVDVAKMSSLGVDNIAILPGKMLYKREDGSMITESEARKLRSQGINIVEERDQFRIRLDKMVKQNSKENNPFNIDAIIRYAEKQKRDAEIAGTYDPKKMLFNIIEDELGHKELVMNGIPIVLPGAGGKKAYMNNYGKAIDGLGMANENYKFAKATMDAYRTYYDYNILENKAKRQELGYDVWMNATRYMSTLMDTSKDSIYADAIQGTTLHGIRQQYDVIDKNLTRARNLFDGSGKLTTRGSDQLNSFFEAHKIGANERELMKRELSFMANTKVSTVFMAAEDLFNDTTKYNVKGGSITFNEMLANAKKNDRDLYERLLQAKEGKATLPGGMNRFPTGPNGELGVLSLDVFGMSANSRKFLGLEKDRSYGFSEFVNLLNADTDGDQVELMMIGFNTNKHFKEYTKQHKMAQEGIFQHQDIIAKFSGYNDKGYVVGVSGASKNRESTYHVAQVMANGKMDVLKMSAEEYHERFGKNALTDTMKKIIGPEFAAKNFMHNISGAVEKHYATMSVASFSSSIIGLVTNTVRDSLKDIHMLNKMLPTADFTKILGTVESGFGAIAQLPIHMNKHTDIKDAYRLTDVMAYFADPTKATTKEYANARNYLSNTVYKNYSDDMKEQQLRWFDSFRNGQGVIGMIEQEFPEYSEHIKAFRRLDTGSESSHYMDVINNKIWEESDASKLSNLLSEKGKARIEATLGAVDQMSKGSFNMDAFKFDNRELFAENSISNGVDRRFNNMISERLLQSKTGKFAGVAGLAVLGLGFFKPMAGMGVTGTNSTNNLFESELELGRGISLNQVDASFSKQAFMYNADIDVNSQDKQEKSATINNLLGNSSLLMQHKNVNTNEKLNINRFNSMGYIGPVGNMNYNRII